MALAENKSREDTLTGNCTLANNNKHVEGKMEFIESSNQNGGTRHYASWKRPFGLRGFRWSPLATSTAEPIKHTKEPPGHEFDPATRNSFANHYSSFASRPPLRTPHWLSPTLAL